MKSISIAMTTYNGARYIRKQLDSLAAQTMSPNELVICDDGSTDETLQIIADFAARAPFPVRVEKNSERMGYRANFMKAVALCNSDLIACCDQDDVWNPGKLECCIAAFKNKDVLLAYHNAIVVTENLEPIGDMAYSALPQPVTPPLTIDPWKNGGWGFTTVISRFLLMFHDLWSQSVDVYELDEKEKPDQWFFFLASCLGSVAYLDGALALYRQHGQNTVGYKNGPTMRGKLDMLIANDMEGIRSREIAGGSRAKILEQAQKRLRGSQRALGVRAAEGYRQLEASYHARQAMYSSGNIFSRSSRLVALKRSGGYLPKHEWGAGRQAFLRDIVRGVIFPTRQSERMRLSGSNYSRNTETVQPPRMADRENKRQRRS